MRKQFPLCWNEMIWKPQNSNDVQTLMLQDYKWCGNTADKTRGEMSAVFEPEINLFEQHIYFLPIIYTELVQSN